MVTSALHVNEEINERSIGSNCDKNLVDVVKTLLQPNIAGYHTGSSHQR